MKCPKCGKEIEKDAVFCRYCGTAIKKDNSPKKNKRWILLLPAGMLLAAAIGFVLYTGILDKPAKDARQAQSVLLQYGYELEDGTIELDAPYITYADGKTEKLQDYKVYINEKVCKQKDGKTDVRDFTGKQKLLLQWEKDGETYQAQKQVRLENRSESSTVEVQEDQQQEETADANAGGKQYPLFAYGLLPASPAGEDTGRGYIDKTGEFAIEPQFDYAARFSEGLAYVYDGAQYGYINTSGEYVIEPQFDDASDFHNGLARVGVGTGEAMLYGYINTDGEYVIEPQFLYAGDFLGELAPVSESDLEEVVYIDRGGNSAIDEIFDDGTLFYQDGYALVMKNGSYGCIDEEGNYVIPLEQDGIDQFGTSFIYRLDLSYDGPQEEQYGRTLFCDGLVPVQSGEKVGYMDKKGEWRIEPQFDSAEPFSEGMAVFYDSLMEKYGYINKNGEQIIEATYDSAGAFSGGAALVSTMVDDWNEEYEYVIINKNGDHKTYLDARYQYPGDVQNGRLYVSLEDGTEALIDIEGNLIKQGGWSSGGDFYKDGYAVVYLDAATSDYGFEEDYRCAIIDRNGNYVVKPEFGHIWGAAE